MEGLAYFCLIFVTAVFAQDYYGASAGRRRVGGVSRTVIIDRGVDTGGLVDHGQTGVLTHTHGVGSVGVGRVIDRGVGIGVHDIGRGGVIDHGGVIDPGGVIDRHDLHGGRREGRFITGGRAGYGGRRRGGRARICRLRGEVPSLDRSGRPEWCSRDPRYNYCEDRRATCRIGRFGGGVCCKSRYPTLGFCSRTQRPGRGQCTRYGSNECRRYGRDYYCETRPGRRYGTCCFGRPGHDDRCRNGERSQGSCTTSRDCRRYGHGRPLQCERRYGALVGGSAYHDIGTGSSYRRGRCCPVRY